MSDSCRVLRHPCAALTHRDEDEEQRRGDRQRDIDDRLCEITNHSGSTGERHRYLFGSLEAANQRASRKGEIGQRADNTDRDQVVDILVVRSVGGAVAIFLQLRKIRLKCEVEGVRTGAEELLPEICVMEDIEGTQPHDTSVRTPGVAHAQQLFHAAEVGVSVDHAEIDEHAQKCRNDKAKASADRDRNRLRNRQIGLFAVKQIERRSDDRRDDQQDINHRGKQDPLHQIAELLVVVVHHQREQPCQLERSEHDRQRQEIALQSGDISRENDQEHHQEHAHTEQRGIAVADQHRHRAESGGHEIEDTFPQGLGDHGHHKQHGERDADKAREHVFVADRREEFHVDLRLRRFELLQHVQRVDIITVEHRQQIDDTAADGKPDKNIFPETVQPGDHEVQEYVDDDQEKSVVSSDGAGAIGDLSPERQIGMRRENSGQRTADKQRCGSPVSEAQCIKEGLAQGVVLFVRRDIGDDQHDLDDQRDRRHGDEKIELLVANTKEAVIEMHKWKVAVKGYRDKQRKNREHRQKEEVHDRI